MNGQRLDRILRCFRIGDPDGAYPIFDAIGSTLAPGRWNTATSPVIYASEYYSTALLERLATAAGVMPPNQHYVEITIPSGTAYEVANIPALPGWDGTPPVVSQTYGERWHRERRSLIVLVPSVVARLDMNVLINPHHPEFSRVNHSVHHPVWWDRRLFGSSG